MHAFMIAYLRYTFFRKNWSNEACVDALKLGIRYAAAKVLRRAQKVVNYLYITSIISACVCVCMYVCVLLLNCNLSINAINGSGFGIEICCQVPTKKSKVTLYFTC